MVSSWKRWAGECAGDITDCRLLDVLTVVYSYSFWQHVLTRTFALWQSTQQLENWFETVYRLRENMTTYPWVAIDGLVHWSGVPARGHRHDCSFPPPHNHHKQTSRLPFWGGNKVPQGHKNLRLVTSLLTCVPILEWYYTAERSNYSSGMDLTSISPWS